MASQECLSNTSYHLDSVEDLTVNKQTPTSASFTKPTSLCNNAATNSSGHHHHTHKIFTRAESHSKANVCHSSCIGIDHELSTACSQCFCSHHHRNMSCNTSHKPPILPRKGKNNKPPVPPRKFAPFANYSEHENIVTTSKSDATTSTTPESQNVTNSIHNGCQKQMNTHEMVVLKPHPRCAINNNIDHDNITIIIFVYNFSN